MPTMGDKLTLEIFEELLQGSDEWHAIRRGIITASTVGQLITPKTIRPAANDTSRSLTATLAAERITGFTEPFHEAADMERGSLDEPYAREVYAENYAPVTELGFMLGKFDGYQIGYSPDGLVGDDGLIEIKSRKQRIQLQTILEDAVPLANVAQIQCGLLVSGREWLDYVSYSGGMPLFVKRVYPDMDWFTAIKDAVQVFEKNAAELIATYTAAIEGRPETERINHYEEIVF